MDEVPRFRKFAGFRDSRQIGAIWTTHLVPIWLLWNGPSGVSSANRSLRTRSIGSTWKSSRNSNYIKTRRRKKAALGKKVTDYKGLTLLEPRQEGGVFSLMMQLLAIHPDLFGFTLVDYDTAFGYDLLVTQDIALDLNRASLRFIELKYELRREFNHSFAKLAAVICWDTKLANDDEVADLTGAVRTMKITSPRSDKSLRYTKYMLVSDTISHNIEVFVLKDFLAEHLKLQFRPRPNLLREAFLSDCGQTLQALSQRPLLQSRALRRSVKVLLSLVLN